MRGGAAGRCGVHSHSECVLAWSSRLYPLLNTASTYICRVYYIIIANIGVCYICGRQQLCEMIMLHRYVTCDPRVGAAGSAVSCARAPRRCGQSGVSDVCPAPTGSAPRPGRSPPADRLRDGGWPSCAVCRAAADGPTASREAPTRAQFNRARAGATPVSPASFA